MQRNPGRAFRSLALSAILVGALGTVAGAQTTPDEQTAVLAAHNQVRQTVAAAETARLGRQVTIPDLTWSPEAAAVAQAWADHLLATDTFEHNGGRGDFGENIYWEFGRDPVTAGSRAVSNWASEQALYTWDTNACTGVCGHYTQIVWANTTAVGCGKATDGNQSYIVCNYAPPGNWNGERPYEPGAAVAPAPVDPAPVDPAPVDPAPVDPAPVDPAPVDPAPVDPAPVASVAPAPVDPAPVDPAPVDPAPVDPAPVAPVAGPITAESSRILSAHNDLRARIAASESARLGKPVTIPQLTWNPEAAAVAQAWADNLLATGAFEHNPGATGLGENIYWEMGMGPETSDQRALDSWASEQASYTWETNACTAECGHYTQAVWAKTTSVGCGVATDGTQAYWVCNYAPPGNMQGERPYEVDAEQPAVSAAPAEPTAAPVEPSAAPAEPTAGPVEPEPSAAPVEPQPSEAAPIAPEPSAVPDASFDPVASGSPDPCIALDPAASPDPSAPPIPCGSPLPSEVPVASEVPFASEAPMDMAYPSDSPAA